MNPIDREARLKPATEGYHSSPRHPGSSPGLTGEPAEGRHARRPFTCAHPFLFVRCVWPFVFGGRGHPFMRQA